MKSTNRNEIQPTGDRPVAIKSASRPHQRMLCLAMAALAGLATSTQAAIPVGDAGSGTDGFTATPTATEWATLNWSGTPADVTDAAGLDAAVSALAAGSIATTLGTSATSPTPSANVLARRNTTLSLLQLRPNGTTGCLLMATLQNTNSAGNDVSKLQISCDYGLIEAGVEELEGLRAYYSMTGLADSWTAIPDLCTATAGTLSTVVTLSSKWVYGAKMYVLWADDDAVGTDDANTLDNVSFTINESLPGANILAFHFGTLGPAAINGLNITANVPHGTAVTTLAPAFTVSSGASCDKASGSTQDFTSPVQYTVTSADALVTRIYTVTVNVLPAGVAYQETFSAACISADFAATYAGFAQSGPLWNASADGYASTDTSGANGALWRTMTTYDWATPLTISADIGSANANGGQSIGVFFSNSSGFATAGITFRPFINSFTNGAFVASADANNRSAFGITNNRQIDPDVVQGGALTNISLTLRENALDNTKFDWLAKVNQTEVWTAVVDGGDGTSGWHTGISKTVLNAAGGLSTFGIAYDGVIPRIDNLTLSFVPPVYEADILTFGLPGYPAVITGTAIAWSVPFSWSVEHLAPAFTISPAATADPVSDTSRDFTTPQSYVITSGGPDPKATRTYEVTVTKLPVSTAKEMLTFVVATGLPPPVIVGDQISVLVPLTANLTALAPTYTVSPLATGSPVAGTPLDFTTPQSYTVTAEDGSTEVYTVTVTKSAIPLYQESFGTFSTSANFAATYPGFSQSGTAVYVPAAGYASTDSQVGYGGLWRTMPTYDWSGALTVSAQIGAADAASGQSIGVFFGNASGLTNAGLTFRPFLPSNTHGAFVGTADGNNRSSFGISGNRGIDPDVAGGGTLTTISLTIRENAADNTRFDWLAKVNDTAIWTAVADGGDGTSGWHPGIPKSALNAAGGLSTFGLGYDGLTPRLDNLTLELALAAPDPYGNWVATFPGFTDSDPTRDPDGDGLCNQQEFAFGLDPTTGASCNPVTAPLDQSNHKFSYTRYAASGLTYTVWTSADLQTWSGPAAVTESVGTPDSAGVATVEVTLTAPPAGDQLFVRVKAE
ncbi:MAG: hypothetical protein NTW21_40200 [Verrucomicrobia bacterium]|nr:hypothetical protein [Verrucomicrobiota bacterium]